MDWKENLALWDRLVIQQKFALVSDFDGTLSPIVNDPDSAMPDPKILPLLSELRDHLLAVAVLSGRAVEDVSERVGVPGLVFIGNHGFERFQDGKIVIPDHVKSYQKAVSKAAKKIRQNLLPGMRVENKGITLSVHYRQAEDEEDVREKFLPKLRDWSDKYGLTLFQGRKVFELRPPVEIDKGTAFIQFVEDFKVQSAVYLGDDTTDASVLEAAKRLRETGKCEAYGLGVHSSNTPAEIHLHEDYSVDGVDGVREFLSALVKAFKASST
ncbi:MAG: trehalose-phosphatase [Anaerolineales bacterium]|jgi:trehalose 6-phosphate phosphatase